MTHHSYLHILSDRISALNAPQSLGTLFTEFREMLWKVIQSANDFYSYKPAWELVTIVCQIDVLEYETTKSVAALKRLQYRVKYALELLPC
jgi:hypothetical protein